VYELEALCNVNVLIFMCLMKDLCQCSYMCFIVKNCRKKIGI
jgi:hypothetical protein